DSQGFSPFGKVTDEGMADIDSLYKGYGEGAPRGRGPHQGKLQQGGNAYLQQKFPKLDYIEKATIIE
ncbi:MAG: peptidylprolyl isomerase, partial [Proteobacteria bacterium]|nr:peptidylprolyl isomerase [Pseudomonadota bacterium]